IRGMCHVGWGQYHMGKSGCSFWYLSGGLGCTGDSVGKGGDFGGKALPHWQAPPVNYSMPSEETSVCKVGLGTRESRRDRMVADFRRIRRAFKRINGRVLEIRMEMDTNTGALGPGNARNGVGIILKAGLKDKVVHVNWYSTRIISLTLVIDGETVNVISAYAPQMGLSKEENKTFWDSLDETLREYPTHQPVFIGGHLNGHIGAAAEGYTGVHGGFSYGVKNEEEGASIQEEAISVSDADGMWSTLARIIKDAVKETLGVTIGSSKTHTACRESLWLSEDVQSKVVAKQARFRELLSCHVGNQEDFIGAHDRYKEAKRQAKIFVAQANEKAYEEIYKKVDTKEGANDIFKITKA
nr:hypothetical protein [Tanacetum cinerariifolium]